MSTSIDNSGSGSTPWLAFLVGGLLVAVAAFAIFAYSGGKIGGPAQPTSKIEFNVKPPVVKPPATPAPAN